uniref:Uncharacterized protein n=1 Tax=Anguilla anguilla TaxID=7936 RepID=A0A0E9QL43_ANGAN
MYDRCRIYGEKKKRIRYSYGKRKKKTLSYAQHVSFLVCCKKLLELLFF